VEYLGDVQTRMLLSQVVISQQYENFDHPSASMLLEFLAIKCRCSFYW